jgi:glycosyltransferase involved in cell wall biosynthesis
MRVLHVITLGELGGAQRYVAELASRQRRCGWTVHLATGTLGWLSDQEHAFSHVHHLPSLVREISPARDYAALRGIRRLLRTTSYDVVHTHSSKAGILGRVAAFLARVPLIAHTSHGSPLAERLSSSRWILYWCAEQLAALLTHRLFAISEVERAALRRWLRLRPGALRVMTIVPDYLRAIPPTWSSTSGSRWELVSVGNLYPNKGYDVLLAALAKVAETYPEVRLTVYGEGPEREALEHLVSGLGLSDRVTLAGHVTDATARLSHAGTFVMPSRKEGLPLALLEAMAVAMPIVATDVGAVPDTLGSGVPVARAGSADELAELLCSTLSSEGPRVALASAGRASFERLLRKDDREATCVMYR